QKYTITVGGNDLQVVYVDFYNSTTATTRIEEVTTDASGKAIIRGLAYGQYYFVETQAPDGYNLLSEPRPVTIDENSHKDEKVVTVANNKGFTLPKTGGIGTILFTATGIAVLAAAFGLIVVSLKKRKHSA
ncbi:MAG: SpaA isopeptide-forming pilin-related protein, partial [Blautia coccoides]